MNGWKKINQKEKKEITIVREKERLNFYFETDVKIIKYAMKKKGLKHKTERETETETETVIPRETKKKRKNGR